MSRKTADKSEVYTTTVSSRGQVVLPAPVRRKLGLRKGTRISIVLGQENEKSMVLRPIETDVIRELRGILKGAGEALDFLQEERRRDRERER
jgi:AbrB family looped-hinge helix DNA binding protein